METITIHKASGNSYSVRKKISTTLRERNAYAIPLSQVLTREFRKLVNDEISKLQRSGVLKLFSNRSGRIRKQEVIIEKAISLSSIKRIVDRIVKYGAKVRDRLGKKYLKSISKESWSLDENANDAFVARKRKILSDTLQRYGKDLDDTIRDVLATAATETRRPSISEISARIRAAALGLSGILGENVAKRIAETEVASFQNFGAYNAYKIAKVKKIQWVSIIDGRTRPGKRAVPRADHIAINGAEVDLGSPFDMPITNTPMLYPGDPKGSVHDIVNCRCTIIPAR